jgi:hypothetical protein
MESGISGSVARNSDHWTTEAATTKFNMCCVMSPYIFIASSQQMQATYSRFYETSAGINEILEDSNL